MEITRESIVNRIIDYENGIDIRGAESIVDELFDIIEKYKGLNNLLEIQAEDLKADSELLRNAMIVVAQLEADKLKLKAKLAHYEDNVVAEYSAMYTMGKLYPVDRPNFSKVNQDGKKYKVIVIGE